MPRINFRKKYLIFDGFSTEDSFFVCADCEGAGFVDILTSQCPDLAVQLTAKHSLLELLLTDPTW